MKLGSEVEYDNRKLIIQECRIYLHKGILCYAYVLGDEVSLLVRRKSNEQLKGVSLLGEVLDRTGQRIKIKLAIDKEQPMDKACWFPYASQANNLFYCMPEITDIDFSAHEQLFMSLDDRKGVTVQSDGNINIFTKQKLLLEAKELINSCF